MMSIEQYLQEAPKAELHVHLEGSIRPQTLLELARRNGARLPADTIEGLQQWFTFRDFSHFIQIYATGSRCLKHSEDYELIVYEFAKEMAQQHVHYAEVTFSASTHQFLRGIPFDVYFTGLTRGREQGQRDFGVEINWVFDIVRDQDDWSDTVKRADYTLCVAKEGMAHGVVALGLGGGEIGHPPEPFAPWFEQARNFGLHSDPHAGEAAGSESIWGAINALNAERIGHGVRSAEDPRLLEYLVEHNIPLEVSPTSNIVLGIYPGYQHHPLPALLAAGVPFTINSDDPPLFNTTLNSEIGLLHSAFHLDLNTINNILLNGVRHSFLPSARKAELLAEFEQELLTLQVRYHVGS